MVNKIDAQRVNAEVIDSVFGKKSRADVQVVRDVPLNQSSQKTAQGSQEQLEVLTPSKKQPDKQKVKDAVELLNKVSRVFNKSLRFKYIEDLDRYWVKVVDLETNKVIKEIPPEEVLKLLKKIHQLIGVLFDEVV